MNQTISVNYNFGTTGKDVNSGEEYFDATTCHEDGQTSPKKPDIRVHRHPDVGMSDQKTQPKSYNTEKEADWQNKNNKTEEQLACLERGRSEEEIFEKLKKIRITDNSEISVTNLDVTWNKMAKPKKTKKYSHNEIRHIARNHNKRTGFVLLLTGPPGTGKTTDGFKMATELATDSYKYVKFKFTCNSISLDLLIKVLNYLVENALYVCIVLDELDNSNLKLISEDIYKNDEIGIFLRQLLKLDQITTESDIKKLKGDILQLKSKLDNSQARYIPSSSNAEIEKRLDEILNFLDWNNLKGLQERFLLLFNKIEKSTNILTMIGNDGPKIYRLLSRFANPEIILRADRVIEVTYNNQNGQEIYQNFIRTYLHFYNKKGEPIKPLKELLLDCTWAQYTEFVKRINPYFALFCINPNYDPLVKTLENVINNEKTRFYEAKS